MRLLELFCGTKSIGKEFEKLGWEVVSLDFDPQFNATITTDILTVPDDYFSGFDVVWASPPCNAFSVAVIGRNWNHDHTPKNDTARKGLAILEKTIAIIKHVAPKMFWIENPRGKMRRMPVMQEFTRHTVAYCQYGDRRQKPTDIWTNTHWKPRPMCNRGDICHVAAPRGSQTGTQGMSNARDKAIIPEELCAEIAHYATDRLKGIKPRIHGELSLFENIA